MSKNQYKMYLIFALLINFTAFAQKHEQNVVVQSVGVENTEQLRTEQAALKTIDDVLIDFCRVW